MNDLANASLFFLIFAVMLVLYGALLVGTGDKALMPINTVHSVRGPEDVRHVGRIVVVVGLVIGAVALAGRLLAG